VSVEEPTGWAIRLDSRQREDGVAAFLNRLDSAVTVEICRGVTGVRRIDPELRQCPGVLTRDHLQRSLD
jgi:hypothetical protein